MIETVSLFGVTCTYLPSSRQITTNSKKEETASKKRSLSPDDCKSILCDGCGRSGHASATCHFKNSKYFNTGGGAYIDSTFLAIRQASVMRKFFIWVYPINTDGNKVDN